jgi:hypothetical protein
MFLSYLTLAVALSLSVIAAYYSIAGLAAIFAAAVIPIIVMGSVLEVGKVVVTLWLHEYWSRCRLLMKLYLVPAVAVLMLVTSMGIFGFLSKAHSDQSLISGDVQSKIAVYDEKIKTQKENIEANRKALKQMDEGVDQVLGRSTDEKGADKAVALRRAQQKERARLQAEISQSQQLVSELNDARAPIAAEVRKVEAEVGPIKYIAQFIYGDNSDANLLEKAVTWVIILLVVVFDPLAIMMLLAATESLKWERQRLFELMKLPVPVPEPKPNYEPDDGALSQDQINQINQMAAEVAVKPEPQEPVAEPVRPAPMKFKDPGEHPQDYDETAVPEPEPEKSLLEQHPYITQGFPHFKDLTPVVYHPETDDELSDEHPTVKDAIKAWKLTNPGETIKRQRQLYEEGKIDHLPWMLSELQLVADNQPPPGTMRGFGAQWPDQPIKGDTFLRVDRLPSALYKFNGVSWIEIDKKISDQYSYNTAYIDHLIAKIDSGEYDPDLLTDAEIEQIQQRLRARNS